MQIISACMSLRLEPLGTESLTKGVTLLRSGSVFARALPHLSDSFQQIPRKLVFITKEAS